MKRNEHKTRRERLADNQRETDGALRLADRALGVYSVDPPRFPGQGAPVIQPPSDPASGYGWAPFRPVPEPKPGQLVAAQPGAPVTGTASWGAAGTPITAGYLLDLGEYNPQLYGRVAVSTYEKMRRGDAQVWATLRACKQPIFSAEWDVRPGVKPSDPGYARAREVADFIKENLFGGLEFEGSTGAIHSQPFHTVIYNALLMLDFGCAIHEDIWTLDGDDIRARALAARLPLTFYRWHTEADGETLLALEQYGYRGQEFVNVSLPMDKACRFSYNQEGANFWGIALNRPMYPHWYIVNGLYRVDAISAERNGVGLPVISLNPGFSSADRASALTFVTQLSAHELAGLVLPPESHFSLVGVTGSTKDIMKSVEHHKREMSKAALQHFLTLGTAPHGSRATASVQHGFFMSASEHVADQVCESINCSTIRRLVRCNFGPDAPVPKLIARNLKSQDLTDILEQLNQMAMSGLVVSERNLRDHIREELDLPVESEEGIVTERGETVTPIGEKDVGEVGRFAPPAKTQGSGKAFSILSEKGLDKPQVIYVARHGETDEDASEHDILSGWSGIGLTPSGKEQARWLGEKLKDAGIVEIHSSDLPRAMETAAIVSEIIGAPVVAEPRLRSWNFGSHLAGKTVQEAQPTLDRALADPERKTAKDGESLAEFMERLRSVAAHIAKRAKVAGPVLALTHSWNVRAFPDVLAGKVPESVKPMTTGGVEKVERARGGWKITSLSDVAPSNNGVKPAPRHFDLREAQGSAASALSALSAVITGPEKARLISDISRQASSQLKRGVPAGELKFSAPLDLEYKLLPPIRILHQSAKRQARAEISKIAEMRQ